MGADDQIQLYFLYFLWVSLYLLWILVKQGKMEWKVWTAAEGTHVVLSLYQFISPLSYDKLSKEKHIIGRNPYFVCVGFKRQWQRRRNWRRAVTPEQLSLDRVFFNFRSCSFICYNFICLGGNIDVIWLVSSWDAAGNKGVEPAGMFRADLERSKSINKPRGLGDISFWTEISKPSSRITPIWGKVCANRGQDIIFAFENNHIFSIFLLWSLLYILYSYLGISSLKGHFMRDRTADFFVDWGK